MIHIKPLKFRYPRYALISMLLGFLFLSSCSEWQNKLSRGVDNLVGVDLKVSYVDGGKIVKSWIVKDGKVTSGKTDTGYSSGYYYFWAENTGYVQIPIDKAMIEAIK